MYYKRGNIYMNNKWRDSIVDQDTNNVSNSIEHIYPENRLFASEHVVDKLYAFFKDFKETEALINNNHDVDKNIHDDLNIKAIEKLIGEHVNALVMTA